MEQILKRLNVHNSEPRVSPCEQKLNYSHVEKRTRVRKYREAVGSLIYLTTCPRPDLSFVVSKLSRYLSEPTEERRVPVKHVLRYLRGTAEKELCSGKRHDKTFGPQAYGDADWATDLNEDGPLKAGTFMFGGQF